MSIRSAVAVILLAVAAAGSSSSIADDEVLKARHRSFMKVATASWRNGEVIVAFRDGTDERDMEAALREGHARSARPSLSGMRFLVRLDSGVPVKDAVARYAHMPAVLYAEPNGVVHATQATTFTPNDRVYPHQWNFRQMNAERTWAIQKGQPTVAVAVLDTGVAYEDYTDPRTGVVFGKAPDWGDTVFLPGYDFVNGDAHPNDDEYHGTHVASTIAEATNNGVGMAGLAFGCALMPVKVLNENGDGTFFDLAEGIDYALGFTQNGQKPVKVINMSLGSESASATVRAAVDRALAAGVVLVAAAGNSAKGTVEFPANIPGVLAVAALDARKERASYSNWGADLHFAAPGGNCDRDDNVYGAPDCVFQQMPDPDFLDIGRHDQFCYCGLDGTSMATPHVAAAAALLFSQGFTDANAVVKALEQTAERLGGAPADGRNDAFGYGLPRPANALPGLGLDTGPKK
jgi:serine protease